MKASELRIGNLIADIDGDVFNIKQENLCDFANGFINVEPIPLTEEWLLKFEYVKFKSNEIYNEWFLIIDGVLKYKIIETVNYLKNNSKFTIPNSDKPIMIQYVHQLQNLYFALTGEELTIKDEVY